MDGWAAYVHRPDEWVCVVLKRTAQDTWQVTVYATAIVGGRDVDSYSIVCTGNTLASVLSDWTNDASNVEFFMTDLRGKKTTQQEELSTVKVSNLVFDKLYLPSKDVDVPYGYENVYYKKGLKGSEFSARDLSDYYFAEFLFKPSTAVFANNRLITPCGNWISVRIVRIGVNKWNLFVDGQDYGLCFGTDLQQIFADWTIPNDNCTVYVTDLRGKIGAVKTSYVKGIAMSMSDKSDKNTVKAVNRLLSELKKISGVQLLVEYHNDASTMDINKNYIVVGTLAEKIGLSTVGITTKTGYVIDTVNGNLCIYSPSGKGLTDAVYGFLKAHFGLTYYTDECFEYTDANPSIGLKERMVVNRDFEYSWAVDGAVTDDGNGDYNDDYIDRLGFANAYEDLGGGWHNLTTLVSEEKYGANGTVEKHPEWFVKKGTDSTYVTLDIVNYADAIAVAMARELAQLINVYTQNMWCVSLPDYVDGDLTTDVYVSFMNKVADCLQDVVNRHVELMLLAYNSTFAAPSIDVVSNNVVSFSVMVAPIESNYYYGFDNDEFVNVDGKTNAWYYEQIELWAQKVDKIYAWNYGAYFDNYFVPLDTITNMQSRYRAYKQAGVSIIHDQGISERIAPDWNALKVYLKSELSKDVNADVDVLVDKFMAAYYGKEAAPFMKQLLVAQQQHYATIANSMRGGNVTRDSLFDKKLWSKDTLDNWYGYILSALEVTSDETLRNRIQLESLTIRYLRQVLHTSILSKLEVVPVGSTTAVKDSLEQIKTDAKALGVNRFAEGYGWVCGGNEKLVDGTVDNLK